jgi:hypothetical protein
MALFSTSFVVPNYARNKPVLSATNSFIDFIQNMRISPITIITGSVFSKIAKIPLPHGIGLFTFYALSGNLIIRKANDNLLLTKKEIECGTEYKITI